MRDSSHARTNEDFSLPDAPITATKRDSVKLATTSSIRSRNQRTVARLRVRCEQPLVRADDVTEVLLDARITRRLQSLGPRALTLRAQRPARQPEVVLVVLDDLDTWQALPALVLDDAALRTVQLLR